jgi:trehalose 6-phosphate phosphatase
VIPILAEAHRPVLERFARSRVVLAFDFDGTLAPIVRDPALARMRDRTRALLAAVAHRYPTLVITGRARSDAMSRLSGLPLVEVVGNHGIEPFESVERHATTVRVWAALLRHKLAGVEGVMIEEKGPSLSVHYRESRVRREALRAIDAAVAALGDGVRVVSGKLVKNVVPEGAPHKGSALQLLRARLELDTALYVGDDTTDEDVFALDEPGRLLSIRVGWDASSAAPYHLRDQREIDDLLEVLLTLRAQRRITAR